MKNVSNTDSLGNHYACRLEALAPEGAALGQPAATTAPALKAPEPPKRTTLVWSTDCRGCRSRQDLHKIAGEGTTWTCPSCGFNN